MRLYSKYVGYDSLLAYVYRGANIMPNAAFNQLISKFGIKSSNI